ncbi:hypothetical protein [Chroococcus sp. FPU101]|uniref:hypothetical protein n=1 Tax=Chroococcus sp. FPU101 TaxID=1974212 RepID=UPI001AA2B882|nr:hypothetical protein [Chroococcus sp. FPU101]GFE71168.1 hypothetical protein CFPU101_37780 [Chroococcus sp. FPU101]
MKKLKLLGAVATLSLLCAELFAMPSADAVQQLSCNGRMNNGWSYSAEYIDGQFTRIRWTRQGKPPQTTNLTYDSINNKDQPVYTGGLMGALGVTLIDLSGGDVQPGSKITVTVDDWGRSQANCGTSSSSTSLTNVLAFQTKSYLVKVDQKNNNFLMTVIEKKTNRPFINNAPATVAPRRNSNDNWTSYVHRGNIIAYARTNPRGEQELELTRSANRRVIEKAI